MTPPDPFEIVVPGHRQPSDLLLRDRNRTPLLTIAMAPDAWQLRHPAATPEQPVRVAWHDGPTSLRVFVDTNIVEVFAADGSVATTRIRGDQPVDHLALDHDEPQQELGVECYRLSAPTQ